MEIMHSRWGEDCSPAELLTPSWFLQDLFLGTRQDYIVDSSLINQFYSREEGKPS